MRLALWDWPTSQKMIKESDIVSSLDGYPGTGIDKLALKTIPPNVYGHTTLNNGKEKMNKCHLKKDIHDYVTWATKLTRMMPLGFDVNLTILAIRWLPKTRTMHLKVHLFQCQIALREKSNVILKLRFRRAFDATVLVIQEIACALNLPCTCLFVCFFFVQNQKRVFIT